MIVKDGWLELQDAAQNSVVQVIAQIAKFNWLEPYRIQEQGEQRGTGFFIDTNGHIITNAHVVHAATKVWIHMPFLGRKIIFADIVSICPDRDFALLRIRPEDNAFLKEQNDAIKPLPLGDSDKVQRTERVLILGYPLGQHSMKSSTGVISGRESDGMRSLIQITAPINPGNSGGPLINSEGEVIGIAISMIFLAQNIGYAIPINELKLVLKDLMSKRFVRRGTLGAYFNYGNDDMARYLGNPIPAGLYVHDAPPDSLLAKVGVKEGDMIYEINGFPIDNFGDTNAPWNHDKISIHELIARFHTGDEIDLTLYRMGERIDIHFTFAITDPFATRYRYPGYDPIEYEVIAGMVLMQLAENHLPYLLTSYPYLIDYVRPENRDKPAIVITHIIPGSLVQRSHSLRPGFIITEINGQQVTTIDTARDAILLSMQTGYLAIKTADHILVVLPFKQILQDEQQLSQDFAYPLSILMRNLVAQLLMKAETQ